MMSIDQKVEREQRENDTVLHLNLMWILRVHSFVPRNNTKFDKFQLL